MLCRATWPRRGSGAHATRWRFGSSTAGGQFRQPRGDKIVAVSPHPRRLHAAISGSTLQIMDTGHMVHHEFPQEVAAAVGKLQAELREAV